MRGLSVSMRSSGCIMYVYGNGKWHSVLRVEGQGQRKIYIASCGHPYPGESDTSEDKAVLDSRYFCGKCLVLLRTTRQD